MVPLPLLPCWVRTFRRQVMEKTVAPPPTTPLDFTQLRAEPAPPPAAGSSADGFLQRRRWKQDALASEDRLMARMDQKQTNMHRAVQSFNAALREGLGEVQAKYRLALADFVETYDARRHGGAVPGNLLKTNVKLEGFKLTNFEFRGLTDATADNVCRGACLFLGCFEHDDVAGNDLANFTVSTHRAGLTKQLFFSDSGKRSLLARCR